MLRVSRQPDGPPEIFRSIQGEGVYAGRPAVFLRLALCNLTCVWCDTRYTWDWQRYDQRKEVMSISAAKAEEEISRFDCRSLVVTGGEPLIQQRAMASLLERLKGGGFWIEVETNGTIAPGKKLLELVDHWSVSPKLENSGNPPSSREKPRVLRLLRDMPRAHFKFVIEKPEDLSEVHAMLEKYGIPASKAVLMPQAQDRETLQKRSRWVANVCEREGYLFSTRLQILLWGNRRGV